MATQPPNTKRLQISKANATTVIVVAVAAFVATFSIIASQALLNKRAYQNRVLTKKQVAADQLKTNVESVNTLVTSYKAFVGTPDNVIGGNSSGTGDRDGDNAKIVLDALPSKYDFPALASSLEKLLANGYKSSSITGNDDEIAQQTQDMSINPQPVEMPFTITTSTSAKSAQDLLKVFERSIRPINVHKITISGSEGSMDISVEASTYYQPQKSLKIKTEVVK